MHQNDFYMFGGDGPGAISPNNDLWKYSIDTTCASCDISTTISDFKAKNSVFIYPNPSSGQIFLSNNSGQFISEISISDVIGRILLKKNINSSQNNIPIDITVLPKGLYTMQINDRITFNLKLIVLE
jgi:hypothetical protein